MGLGTLSNHWKVNDTPIYAPSHSKPGFSHDNIVSDDSGRMESGYMHIRWVRPDVLKINLTWDKLTGDEVTRIIDLMQGKEFTFTYFDRGVKTLHGYCGKVEYTLVSEVLHESEGGLYKSIQANVIEM